MIQIRQPCRQSRHRKGPRQRLGKLQPGQRLLVDLWQAQPVLSARIDHIAPGRRPQVSPQPDAQVIDPLCLVGDSAERRLQRRVHPVPRPRPPAQVHRRRG